MATLCEKLLSDDITPNCDDPVVTGLENKAVLINKQDIDIANVIYNSTRKNVVEDLAILVGKKGYACLIPGNSPLNGTNTTMVPGTNTNKWTSNAPIIVLGNDPDVCNKIIDGLTNGQFVLVVENKHKNLNKATTPGDSAFQIYGLQKGLKASAGLNDKYAEEVDGGWSVTLTETAHPKSAIFFYDTDYATTKTAFDNLLVTVAP